MPKQRLTITLSRSTLNKIDKMIDGKTIRSRSHAIDSLLQQALQPKITTAVILAGGQKQKNSQKQKAGAAYSATSDHETAADRNHQKQASRPKALTSLGDKPLIIYTLEHLHKFGVKTTYILSNKEGREIKKALKQFKAPMQLNWVEEDEPLGTAGALRNIAHKLNEPFFCLHGDILTNIDLQEFARFHEQQQGVATMAVKPREPQDCYDNVFIQGNKVVDFQPKQEGQTVSIVNSGVYLFNPSITNLIPQHTPSMLETDVFPKLLKSGQLFAYTFQGIWFDVSSDQNYKQAIANIS
jgi:NDP-sugar pyrophosphorylase family protein